MSKCPNHEEDFFQIFYASQKVQTFMLAYVWYSMTQARFRYWELKLAKSFSIGCDAETYFCQTQNFDFTDKLIISLFQSSGSLNKLDTKKFYLEK